MPLNIYLAGKIRKNDWRTTIAGDMFRIEDELYNAAVSEEFNPTALYFPVAEKSIFGEHNYVGPYFIGCDHGCFHGDASHGSGLSGSGCAGPILFGKDLLGARSLVHEACLNAIRRSDVVFCYLDSLDAFGTFIELGYARGLGDVDVWVHINRDIFNTTLKTSDGGYGSSDLWFTLQTADKTCVSNDPPSQVLKQMLRPDFRTMPYTEYLKSDHWKATRESAVQRAGNACQFCRSTERLNVHHNTYERLGEELPTDLLVLCQTCHGTLHAVENGRPTRMPVKA